MDGGPKKISFSTYIIIAVALITFLTIKDKYFPKENSSDSSPIVKKEKDTYYNSIKDKLHNTKWREARTYDGEFRDISTALSKNNIRVCGEYYVRLVGDNEYLVACTPDGQTWNYFIVWSRVGSVYKADSETEMAIEPPY